MVCSKYTPEYVLILKTESNVIAIYYRFEKIYVVVFYRIEFPVTVPFPDDGRRGLPHTFMRRARIAFNRQRIEIMTIGRQFYFRITVQVAHSLAHREPALDQLPVALAAAQNLEIV